MAQGKHSGVLPIDRGWSWVVCFASFLCIFVMGTAMQVLSVLFLELVNEFNSSVTITSLTVMCFVMSLSVSSVVSTSVLVPIFGERPVIVVAGALFAACSVGYYMAPNIAVFIAFSAGKGTCVGLVFVPSVSLLSYYFNRRRSLATTISNSGICVASIVSPPVIRAVTAEYGMRGAFLVLAAFELHMVAAGLLMRPVSSYRAVPREDTGITALDDTETALMKDKSINEMHDVTAGTGVGNDLEQNVQAQSLTRDTNDILQSDADDMNTTYNNRRFYDRVDSHVSDVILESPEDPEFSETEEPVPSEKFVPRENSRKETLSDENNRKESLSSENHKRQRVSRQSSKKELVSRHSFRRDSASRRDSSSQNSYHGSNWSISHKHPGHLLHRESIMSVTSGLEAAVTGLSLQDPVLEEDTEKVQGWKSCCFISVVRRIFDPILFRQWAFRVFLISAVPSATSQYLLQYIPTIAVIKGANKDEAATLMTIIGSVDLVSRLAVGIFADTHLLRSTQIVAISQICQGIFLQFNPLFNNFNKMIAMIVVMGLFIGTRQSLLPMMLIEIVGIEKMARCLGITAMLATISAASHSPMLSAILEATGSYDIILHYVGVALIVGAVIMLFMPLLARVDARREANKMAA